MDLETENRIAAILLKEAAELRRQAEKDGVRAYLQKPTVRARPNSRFLTATVLGVQQANKAVEVNDLWRVRQKERELDDRLKGRSRAESGSGRSHRDINRPSSSASDPYYKDDGNGADTYPSSANMAQRCYSSEDEGLRDKEIEEFLHSRVKRGRGSVGSKMDETGPYLPRSPETSGKLSRSPDVKKERVALGPEKPSSLRYYCSSSSDDEINRHTRKRAKKDRSKSSERKHSSKHKTKEKKDKKKKKRSKHDK